MKTTLLPLACVLILAGCGEGGSPSPKAAGPSEPNTAARPDREAALNRRIGALSDEAGELRAKVVQLEAENAAFRARLETEPAETAHQSAVPLEPETPPPMTEAPPRGQPITAAQRAQLMREDVAFNPGRIESSETPVTEDTALTAGQDIQIKWNGTWWAGLITGIEPDGMVRVRYFGWGSYPEEIVPRSDLQWDPAARARALEATYGPAR